MLINFARLVANENMKIYYRVRTWVMLLLLVLFNTAMPAMLYWTKAPIDAWTVFTWTESVTIYLSMIFTVMIAADIVAGEFAGGTIKLLLIRPWSRGKILLSKFVSMCLFLLLCTLITAVVGITASLLLFSGNTGLDHTFGGSSMDSSLLLLLTDTIQMFVISLIAFMLSTVFRSGGLAIGLSLLFMFTKDIFSLIFNPERFVWAKYLLFLHTDLSGYLKSPVGPGGVGVGFSVTLLIAYCLLFILISWIAFAKRDVEA